MRHLNLKTIAAVAVLVASTAAVLAGNTTFFTVIGDLAFPFTAPTKSAPGTIDNMAIGGTNPQNGTFLALVANSISGVVTNTSPTPLTQGAPNAQTVSATLTAANLQAGIITVSQGASGASTLTLPLGTAMDTAFPNAVVNSAFDFSIANISVTSGETATVAAATGFTIVGEATMAITTSGRFRARKTGTGTWVLYRLA